MIDWIPTSERLPTKSGYYMYSQRIHYKYSDHIKYIVGVSYYQHKAKIWKTLGRGVEVVAWAEIEQPYTINGEKVKPSTNGRIFEVCNI